jgi:hypothetical protein
MPGKVLASMDTRVMSFKEWKHGAYVRPAVPIANVQARKIGMTGSFQMLYPLKTGIISRTTKYGM